jgi:hypothetical protein
MMEQSKIEIAAFIAALPSSAAAAENSPIVAAASQAQPGAGTVSDSGSLAAAAGNRQISAAATEDSSSAATSAAETENSTVSKQPAVESQMTPASAAKAILAAVADVHVEAETTSGPRRTAEEMSSAVPPVPTATPTDEAARPFRAYSGGSGAVLQGQKTPSSPLGVAKETTPFSPIA